MGPRRATRPASRARATRHAPRADAASEEPANFSQSHSPRSALLRRRRRYPERRRRRGKLGGLGSWHGAEGRRRVPPADRRRPRARGPAATVGDRHAARGAAVPRRALALRRCALWAQRTALRCSGQRSGRCRRVLPRTGAVCGAPGAVPARASDSFPLDLRPRARAVTRGTRAAGRRASTLRGAATATPPEWAQSDRKDSRTPEEEAG